MADRCPSCRRTAYRGTTREVRPDECVLEDGASCRAYRHGVEVGRAERLHPLMQLDTSTGEVRILDSVVAMEGGPR